MNGQNPSVDTSNAVASMENISKPLKVNNKRKILLFSVLLIVIIALVVSAYMIFSQREDMTPTESEAFSELKENQLEYVNSTYKFSLIVDKEWNINEFGTKLEINTTNNGKISFEAFNNQEFAAINSIDQKFCDSFETGFKEGLGNTEVSEQFDFVLFKNSSGLDGCTAEGEILSGFKQRYNIFYNSATKEVYSIFYTSTDLKTEQELVDTIESFRMIAQ